MWRMLCSHIVHVAQSPVPPKRDQLKNNRKGLRLRAPLKWMSALQVISTWLQAPLTVQPSCTNSSNNSYNSINKLWNRSIQFRSQLLLWALASATVIWAPPQLWLRLVSCLSKPFSSNSSSSFRPPRWWVPCSWPESCPWTKTRTTDIVDICSDHDIV